MHALLFDAQLSELNLPFSLSDNVEVELTRTLLSRLPPEEKNRISNRTKTPKGRTRRFALCIQEEHNNYAEWDTAFTAASLNLSMALTALGLAIRNLSGGDIEFFIAPGENEINEPSVYRHGDWRRWEWYKSQEKASERFALAQKVLTGIDPPLITNDVISDSYSPLQYALAQFHWGMKHITWQSRFSTIVTALSVLTPPVAGAGIRAGTALSSSWFLEPDNFERREILFKNLLDVMQVRNKIAHGDEQELPARLQSGGKDWQPTLTTLDSTVRSLFVKVLTDTRLRELFSERTTQVEFIRKCILGAPNHS